MVYLLYISSHVGNVGDVVHALLYFYFLTMGSGVGSVTFANMGACSE
jgi:hypothetical protein